MRQPLVRNSITRAHLEGVVLGMFIMLAILWIGEPVITGNWSML